jgi:hypothetical protein
MTKNCKPFLNTSVQQSVGEVGDMRIESLIGRVYYIVNVLSLPLVFGRHSRLKATTWLSKLSQSPSVGSISWCSWWPSCSYATSLTYGGYDRFQRGFTSYLEGAIAELVCRQVERGASCWSCSRIIVVPVPVPVPWRNR